MIGRFRADGWSDNELYAYDYSFVTSFATDAEDIREQVDAIIARTGAAKVDIIAHSAGAVSSRYYIKNLGGDSKVDAWVSLAGPNHGTDTADNCSFAPCVEIRLGSDFSGDTQCRRRDSRIRSLRDVVVGVRRTSQPRFSVLLAGASNHQSACLAHFNFLIDPVVYSQVRDWIE